MEPDRRRLIARHALEVLAAAGARGLTHRAVDQAADLPAGSTSYYHRTRAALLDACLDELVRQDQDDLAAMARLRAGDRDGLAAALAEVLHRWTTTQRTRQLARYELFLEAVRRPDLAATLHQGGATIRAAVADVLAGLGAPDARRRADWLVAAVEGLVLERIAGAKAGEPVARDTFAGAARWLVEAALAPGAPSS